MSDLFWKARELKQLLNARGGGGGGHRKRKPKKQSSRSGGIPFFSNISSSSGRTFDVSNTSTTNRAQVAVYRFNPAQNVYVKYQEFGLIEPTHPARYSYVDIQPTKQYFLWRFEGRDLPFRPTMTAAAMDMFTRKKKLTYPMWSYTKLV
jgi:hypothetical protein